MPTPAFAQYTGGVGDGYEAATLGTDIYLGGSEQGILTATSSEASTLAHGDPAKLVFTQIPSATKHSIPFQRQPIVEIRDVNDNVIITDNSTQVSLGIYDNPGDGSISRAVNNDRFTRGRAL